MVGLLAVLIVLLLAAGVTIAVLDQPDSDDVVIDGGTPGGPTPFEDRDPLDDVDGTPTPTGTPTQESPTPGTPTPDTTAPGTPTPTATDGVAPTGTPTATPTATPPATATPSPTPTGRDVAEADNARPTGAMPDTGFGLIALAVLAAAGGFAALRNTRPRG